MPNHVSRYNSPLVRALYEGCQIEAVTRKLGLGNRGGGPRPDYVELIITA